MALREEASHLITDQKLSRSETHFLTEDLWTRDLLCITCTQSLNRKNLTLVTGAQMHLVLHSPSRTAKDRLRREGGDTMSTVMTGERDPLKVVELMMKMSHLMKTWLFWIIITVICTSSSAKIALLVSHLPWKGLLTCGLELGLHMGSTGVGCALR